MTTFYVYLTCLCRAVTLLYNPHIRVIWDDGLGGMRSECVNFRSIILLQSFAQSSPYMIRALYWKADRVPVIQLWLVYSFHIVWGVQNSLWCQHNKDNWGSWPITILKPLFFTFSLVLMQYRFWNEISHWQFEVETWVN